MSKSTPIEGYREIAEALGSAATLPEILQAIEALKAATVPSREEENSQIEREQIPHRLREVGRQWLYLLPTKTQEDYVVGDDGMPWKLSGAARPKSESYGPLRAELLKDPETAQAYAEMQEHHDKKGTEP